MRRKQDLLSLSLAVEEIRRNQGLLLLVLLVSDVSCVFLHTVVSLVPLETAAEQRDEKGNQRTTRERVLPFLFCSLSLSLCSAPMSIPRDIAWRTAFPFRFLSSPFRPYGRGRRGGAADVRQEESNPLPSISDQCCSTCHDGRESQSLASRTSTSAT